MNLDADSLAQWQAAVRKMHVHAENLQERAAANGLLRNDEPVNPSLFLERIFPVSCVAVPNLCLAAIGRYLAQYADALPPGLQTMVDQAGPEAGRPVRGACVAWRGYGLLLADERDSDEEQRFSLMHEGSHFFLDHFLPRSDALRRHGPKICDVLDGLRLPTQSERFDALLRGTRLVWHSHLYDRNAPLRSTPEYHADALACLLLAPPDALPDLLQSTPASLTEYLQLYFRLPPSIAAPYAHALTEIYQPRRPESGLLSRLLRRG